MKRQGSSSPGISVVKIRHTSGRGLFPTSSPVSSWFPIWRMKVLESLMIEILVFLHVDK